MKPLSLVLGFLPWIAFSLLSNRLAADGIAWSALIAVAITVVSIATAKPRTPPKILNVASGVLFTVIAVVGFTGGAGVDEWLFTWGAPGVGVVLGLFVIATVPVMPFTAQYARDTTPKAYWTSPLFIRINRVLSLAWGVAITALGVCSVVVSAIDHERHSVADPQLLDLLLKWVLPIAVIWFMVSFTMRFPDKARGQRPQPAEAADPSVRAG